jgi:hypothetical protein
VLRYLSYSLRKTSLQQPVLFNHGTKLH